jgi:hypothetical protein
MPILICESYVLHQSVLCKQNSSTPTHQTGKTSGLFTLANGLLTHACLPKSILPSSSPADDLLPTRTKPVRECSIISQHFFASLCLICINSYVVNLVTKVEDAAGLAMHVGPKTQISTPAQASSSRHGPSSTNLASPANCC